MKGVSLCCSSYCQDIKADRVVLKGEPVWRALSIDMPFLGAASVDGTVVACFFLVFLAPAHSAVVECNSLVPALMWRSDDLHILKFPDGP